VAYDFGSAGLGITNPFKQEGAIRALGGAAVSAIGLYSIFNITDVIEQNIVQAWVFAIVGLCLLVAGLRRLGSGLYYLFKFFVGRSVPSSLAFNHTPSEAENAKQEHKEGVLAYNASTLESMLMGRKNTTFKEPEGWMGRFVHSIFPKLVFLPYPVRNVLQEVVSVLATTLIAFVAFGLTYFVSSSGLAGQAGHIIVPAFSVLLLIYLIAAWRSAANAVRIDRVKVLQSAGAASLAKVIAFSIIFPVVIGFAYQFISTRFNNRFMVQEVFEDAVIFSAWPSLTVLLLLGGVASALVLYMVVIRSRASLPVTEVSEFRENLQESVHPREIFINIETIVLANRRYKEIPNRTYRAFDPKLDEQSQGKGSFVGELIIETQPEFKQVEQSGAFKGARLGSAIAGQVLLVIGAFLFYSLSEQVGISIEYVKDLYANSPSMQGSDQAVISRLKPVVAESSVLIVGFISTIFMWQIVSHIGRMLENFANVFYAELQFDSLLMFMKTEGTFSESKISTGMSIHDSTRSENVVVKSSITPWVVSSRITTSTYATAGSQNIEMPRYVMSMEKNEDELNSIIGEIREFLKGRENIAGFTNSADLQHAENILKVNQASRSNPTLLDNKEDEEAAGMLRNEQQASKDQNG